MARTVDGGSHWSTEFTTPTPALQVDAPNSQDVFSLLNGCDKGNLCNQTAVIGTFDGGRYWQTLFRSHNFIGASISFPTKQDGFLAGSIPQPDGISQDLLYATTDGGVTWTARASPCTGAGTNSAAVSFQSANSGWLVCGGQPGANEQVKSLYKTLDGGQSWTLLSSSGVASTGSAETDMPLAGYVQTLFFVSPQRGFMGLDRGGVFETDDGGQLWHPVFRPPLPANADLVLSVGFSGRQNGWMLAGEGPPLYTTSDGGRSWNVAYPSPSPASSVSFLSPALGYGAGWTDDGAMILRSGDRGKTWSYVGDAPVQVSSLEVLGPTAIVVAGQHGIYRSANGGRTWVADSLPSGWYPANLALTSETSGWVVGFAPKLGRKLFVQRSGEGWSPLPTPFSPEGIAPLAGGTLLAVGTPKVSQLFIRGAGGQPAPIHLDHGVPYLWRSQDGGLHWTPLSIPGWKHGESIPVGMRVGDRGVVALWSQGHVWRSVNGGRTWREISFPRPMNIEDLTFADAANGWLLTAGGNLYATTDGGNSWTQLTTGQVY